MYAYNKEYILNLTYKRFKVFLLYQVKWDDLVVKNFK